MSRARPRCFTSSASSRMDGSVITRPSPRARGLGVVDRGQEFGAPALTLLPEGKSFLDGFVFAAQPARFDGAAGEGLLLGCERNGHRFQGEGKPPRRQVRQGRGAGHAREMAGSPTQRAEAWRMRLT